MKQPKRKMTLGKKILIGIGVLLLIGIIGSQLEEGEKGNEIKHATSAISVAENPVESSGDKPTYAKIGDQVEVGNFSYKVNNLQFAKTIGDEFMRETADGVFLIVNMTFRNNDNEEHTLDNSFFKLTDENGIEFESSTEGSTALEMSGNETLFLKQCNPQITKSGLLVFEVPERKIYDLHLSGGFWTGKTAVVKLTTN